MAHFPIERALAQGVLSVLPVLLFLLALDLIDTYRLLTLWRVVRIVLVGCAVAAVCWLLNTAVYASGAVSPHIWVRSGAPVLEELAKSLYAIWLIRTNRVAFMVDAAISGFALGAGFSVVENITYIPDLGAAALFTAAVRGLGTAMMHGGTTVVFAVLSNNRAEIRRDGWLRVFLPGLAIAICIHAFYNQRLLPPLYQAAVILVALPALLSFIFWRSEKVLEQWLGTRLDKDIDLLQMLASNSFSATPAGHYLQSLKSTFGAEMVGDMLCHLQVSLELSARAKGDLLRREMGFPVAADPGLPAQLRELSWLDARIGRAGRLALAPLLGQSRRDIWEMRRLPAE